MNLIYVNQLPSIPLSCTYKTMQGVESSQAFKGVWRRWALGGIRPVEKYSKAFMAYSIFINITVILFLPISFGKQNLQEHDVQSILHNLAMTLTFISFSFKHWFILFCKRNRNIFKLLQKLDQRIQNEKEMQCIRGVVKLCDRLLFGYSVIFYMSYCNYIMTSLLNKGQLVLPGWFPFDLSVKSNFWIAYVYQTCAIAITLIQNIAHDVYPPIYISVLTAHIEALGKRVKVIGWNLEDNGLKTYDKLVACIEDHLDIMSLFREIAAMIKCSLFIQFTVTAFILCIGAVNLIFFTTQFLEMAAIASYLAAVTLEVFPVCYCMNRMIEHNSVLTNSVYACNWIHQDLKFKKAVIMFIQKTQENMIMYAGNIAPINLPTFLNILKFSFSMFTLLSKVNK